MKENSYVASSATRRGCGEKENLNEINNFAHKETVAKALSVFLMVLAVFFLVKTYGVLKENKFIGQDIVAQNTISVSGEGEVSAVPDIAKFSFTVKEEAKTVSMAQKKATEKMNNAIDFLKKSGVEEKNIKTTGYNIYPRYEWQNKASSNYPHPDKKRVLIGYEVSQNISVKLKDIDKAGEILAGIGSLEVTNVSGLNFEIDDEDALKRQARKQAIEKAKTKAKELAKDLGVNLVRIVNYSSSEGNLYSRYGVMEMTKASGIDMANEIPSPEIPIGENEIKITVNITYEIK